MVQKRSDRAWQANFGLGHPKTQMTESKRYTASYNIYIYIYIGSEDFGIVLPCNPFIAMWPQTPILMIDAS